MISRSCNLAGAVIAQAHPPISGLFAKGRAAKDRNVPWRMPGRDFRYHLLSIGVNRDANGASVRSAERDAFGISWTFAQLGYWRAERNRCLTGAQATPPAIDRHLAHSAGLQGLDLLLLFYSGHIFSIDPI